jgi:hypothetical protein
VGWGKIPVCSADRGEGRGRCSRSAAWVACTQVDSAALSIRGEPEIYRTVVGRYREQVRQTQLVFSSSFMVERQREFTATMSG